MEQITTGRAGPEHQPVVLPAERPMPPVDSVRPPENIRPIRPEVVGQLPVKQPQQPAVPTENVVQMPVQPQSQAQEFQSRGGSIYGFVKEITRETNPAAKAAKLIELRQELAYRNGLKNPTKEAK